MKKHVFTDPERYAVWKHHGKKCYLCDQPVRLVDVTCDHVIPEALLNKPTELYSVLGQFGLNGCFEINDFNNWMPAHVKCNQKKASASFRPTPMIQAILDRLIRDSEKVRGIAHRFTENDSRDLLLTQILHLLSTGKITEEEIVSRFPKGRPIKDEDVATLYDEVCLHVDPGRWKMVGRSGGIATVTDGRLGGVTPLCPKPHISWECPHCLHYGPWNGVKCMTCGMMSDPND